MSSSFVGRTIGKYEIVETLGHGGMASVYKGYQRDVDRYVAVKVLPPHPGQDALFIERFEREARTVARLQHPHILPMFDFGEDNGVLYIITAYIDGGTLRDLIARGQMPLDRVERMFSHLASAVDYAHRQGVVHRDIKPDNVLLDSEGFAHLSDFGIVKIVQGDDSGLTATGGLIGTPAYMSPEQVQGTNVDHRGDIYSLGIVLYEMLTNTQPFISDTPIQVVLRQINDPPPPLKQYRADLPDAVETVLQRALAKDPKKRYQSANTFAEDFHHALRGESISEMHTATAPRPYPTHETTELKASPTADTINVTTAADVPDFEIIRTPPQVQVIRERIGSPLVLLGGFLIIAIMVVLIVLLMTNDAAVDPEPTAAAFVPTIAPTQPPVDPSIPTYGEISFSTTDQLGDTVNITADRMARLSGDAVYVAQLVNTATDETLPLGTLRVDAFGSGLLQYVDPEARSLPTLYNALTITRADSQETVEDGTVVYSASIPSDVTNALREIFIESMQGDGATEDQPGDSLLETALAEAEIGEQHAGLAANSRTVPSMLSHVEHTLNIYNGTEIDYNANDRAENPGRKIGVLPMLDAIEQAVDTASTGAPPRVQTELDLIRVCVINVRDWTLELLELEQIMLETDTLEAVENERTEATRLANTIINGQDLNGNGDVEAFEGECGLNQIYDYGIAASAMSLTEGALADAV